MLAILTAIHGRHALAVAMLQHTAARAVAVSDVGKVRIFAVLSPEDEQALGPICRRLGVSYIVQANSPLSLKWQSGITHIKITYPAVEAIMTLGSDDFISDDYLRMCFDLLANKTSMGWGLESVHVLDRKTGRLGRWTCKNIPRPKLPQMKLLRPLAIPAGAGRVYTAELLSRVGWCLWRVGRNVGLDMTCSLRLAKMGYALDVVKAKDVAVVDVKTATNMHGFDEMEYADTMEPDEAKTFLSVHGLVGVFDPQDGVIQAVQDALKSAPGQAVTQRVGLWVKAGQVYSGGRIALTMYALALAEAGAEVWFITDGDLAWEKDYTFPANFHLSLLGDPYPEDLDLLITDCRGAVARECAKFKQDHPTIPLGVVAFETPNWAKKYDHVLGHTMARESFVEIEQHADFLIAISKEGAKYLGEFYDDGKPIEVIYPSINTVAIDNAKPTKMPRPYAVFCARPTKHKHAEVAVRAVMQSPVPMDLVFIGAPGLYKPVGKPNHRIHVKRGISDVEKYGFMKGAHVVLAPSTFEGFGLVPGEALVCGTPAVTYDLPVLREAYGDDVIFAGHDNADDFVEKAHEVMRAKKPRSSAIRRTREKFGMDGLPERIQKTRFHAVTQTRLSVAMICYAMPIPLVKATIESLYDVADEINIAYGPVPFWQEVADDGALEAIRNFDDPGHKLNIEAREVWTDKAEMWAWCGRVQTGNYQLVTGADMVWVGIDKWLAAGIKWGTPRWVNCWHDLEHWIHGSEKRPGRWGERMDPIGSLCRHRLFGYWRHSYQWLSHAEPVDFAGNPLWSIEENRRTSELVPECVCYHLGHVLPPQDMARKHDYYTSRDGDDAHGAYWRDWKGKPGPHGDGIICKVDWELPSAVHAAVADLVACENNPR